MMVTFVSQCEKKALNKTRRVLDAFANRIGDNTWQTVITNEGLHAVKKLLRKLLKISCFILFTFLNILKLIRLAKGKIKK